MMPSLQACVLTLALILVGAGKRWATLAREARDKPNIILFLADDMGYGDLASFGHPSQEWGHIDQMGIEGMRFSRWYSPDVLCSPSRGAMLTGRLPVRVGLHGPARVFEMGSSYGLPKSEITLAEMLRDQGYHTGMVGKWHLGINEFSPNDGNHLPYHHGFASVGHLLPFTNHWHCDETKLFVAAPDRHYCLLYYNDSIIQQPLSHRNLTQRLVHDTKAFIYDHREQPFFFYLSFPQVHADMFSSPQFAGSSKRGRYGDSVNEMSWAVGETLATIRELGLEENTLAVFLSDHGPQLELCSEGGSPGILTGSKDATWEGGIRVPAFAWWPGTVPANSHSQAIVSSMDLFATFAELSGGAVPGDRVMDSRSLVPTLSRGAGEHRRVLLHYVSDVLMAVTYGEFKAHFRTKPRPNLEDLAKHCGQGWSPIRPYHVCFKTDERCVKAHDPPLLYHIGRDPSELSPLNVKLFPGILGEIGRVVAEHQQSLVKGSPLFVGRSQALTPCCNPPYCWCNYEREIYLRELGL